MTDPDSAAERTPVYATHALVETLCVLAADADPRPLSVALATSAPPDLDPSDGPGTPLADLPADVAVFSDFYFPAAGRALDAVFGVDLATPSGSTEGRFLSHPMGEPDPTVSDDFAARLLVAVPPWDVADVRAYDRRGRRPLVLVAANAPEEEL
ncbi:hypothetical protein [Halarchaeum sp. P4]|uniref:hypothetical protein n=1 Tax=Halarchaeum sp. P4 TaxID=3421639 RepID=UPI003EBED375